MAATHSSTGHGIGEGKTTHMPTEMEPLTKCGGETLNEGFPKD